MRVQPNKPLLRIPPSDEVLVAMADIDGLHQKLTEVLVAIGRIEENAIYRADQLSEVIGKQDLITARQDRIEDAHRDVVATLLTLQWIGRFAIGAIAIAVSVVAIYY